MKTEDLCGVVRGATPDEMLRLIRAQDITLDYRLADWRETIGKGGVGGKG